MRRRKRNGRDWGGVLTGIGLGAGLMYLLDPAGGRGKRVAQGAGERARRAAQGASEGARRPADAAARPFRSGTADGDDGAGEQGTEGAQEALGAELAGIIDEEWPSSRRCVAATVGSGLIAYGVRRGDGVGLAVGSAGAALLARAGTNRPLIRAAHLRSGPPMIEVHKTVTIDAPLDLVYGLWTRYETFPRFMTTLKEVVDLGQGRSHWTVNGPAGLPVSWDAEVTRIVPNQTLGWRSLPGSAVPNAGIIEFQPTPEGGTRVDIRLSYHPPAGTLGHLAAKLFGADARSQMDEDLRTLKSSLEAGHTEPSAVPNDAVPVS